MDKAAPSLTSHSITLVVGLLVGIALGTLGYSLWTSSSTAVLTTADEAGLGNDTPTQVAVESAAPGKDASTTPSSQLPQPRRELEPEVDPSIGVIVYGAVRDQAGKPVASAFVGFTPETPSEPSTFVEVKKGGYSTHGLRPGRYKTVVRGRGFNDSQGHADIPDAPVFRCDLTAKRAYTLAVRVRTPAGQPVSEALHAAGIFTIHLNAVATKMPLKALPMTDMRYHGRYGIGTWSHARSSPRPGAKVDAPDVLGRLELSAPPPCYVSLVHKHIILASQQVQQGQHQLIFELPLNAIHATTATVRGKSLATKIVDTSSLSTEPFRLVLQPTHLVTLDNSKMSPQRVLTAQIRDSQRRLVYAVYLTGPYAYKPSLPTGDYTFEIFEHQKRVQSGAFNVGGTTATTILVTG